MIFTPNANELNLISIITKYYRGDYALLRFTPTMLNKSIIDASGNIRNLLKNNNLIDYDNIAPGGEKIFLYGSLITNEVKDIKISFYRPSTKKGDPRFCLYGIRQVIRPDEMIYITIFNNTICIIPLIDSLFNESIMSDFFGYKPENEDLNACLALLKKIMHKNIKSVSPNKLNPKDVGNTLENCLNIAPNSDKHADFNNKIELKGKIKGKNTKDTLFSMVPNWAISKISSSPEMILTYGYPSTNPHHLGFTDLFVTVSNKPNNQGLYLEIDEDNEQLLQKHVDSNNNETICCVWTFAELKNRLMLKHPETLWVLAEQLFINNEIYFNYESIEHTKIPIFSSFLLLISQGIITYDWRGRVRPDGTGYKDKGHCFRIKPKYRNLLFGESETLDI